MRWEARKTGREERLVDFESELKRCIGHYTYVPSAAWKEKLRVWAMAVADQEDSHAGESKQDLSAGLQTCTK